MKRLIYFVLAFVLMLVIFFCDRTNVKGEGTVVLTYIYGEKNVTQVLPQEEAATVVDILDGNLLLGPLSFDIPSCGFDEDISFQIGGQIYAIACDRCNGVLECGTQRYFEISQEEIDYIHALFEKYGGRFPCV